MDAASTVETASEVSGEPARKPGFQPGDPRINLGGRPKKVKHPYLQPPEDGASATLQDMRHVHLNGKQHDKTQAQVHLRELQVKDPKGFLAQLTVLEKQHREKVQEKVKAVEKDEGVERCMELIEEWLRENKDA